MNKPRNNKSELPEEFRPFFWDISDMSVIDIKDDKFFIIERLLNEGNEKSLQWLFQNYSHDEIKEIVYNSRRLTLKTAYCWQNYFDLKREEMRCFGAPLTNEESAFLKR